MTQQSTIERAAKLQRPGIAWIGRFRLDDGFVDFTVSEADLERDTRWAATLLNEYGVSPGEHILVTSRPSETPWFDAFREAAKSLGAVISNGESWGWDARRSEMYIRRLKTVVILGLSSETVAGIGQITDAAQQLGSVRRIVARREALGALRELGIDADYFLQVGPAIAVSAPDGGLRYDESEWKIESIDGELVVSSVGPRATTFDRQRTGVSGTVTGSQIMLADSA